MSSFPECESFLCLKYLCVHTPANHSFTHVAVSVLQTVLVMQYLSLSQTYLIRPTKHKRSEDGNSDNTRGKLKLLIVSENVKILKKLNHINKPKKKVNCIH